MDIVVKGRNVEVPDHYRVHVADKLQKVERYDQKIQRIDVELLHERNPRQSEHCQHIEITCVSRGPIIRAEATAGDFYTALDLAAAKLDYRLRRAADRRRVHRGLKSPISVGEATAGLPMFEPPSADGISVDGHGVDHDEDQPWHIVREKEFSAVPMTIDDALYQMELVGHDFFLFNDKDSGRPSVVYRRKAYDYGVIALAL
ncbi:ribosome hibernation-promoting factor, HPF/YfiA family [Hamadaea tsunoensis]|uniref:ribosome hibernation-promoting factor, HPF/YfiA family n=1 Tax=Hamadaea tsunoensis TaxID=53368 RepID=UPI0004274797|nr:ribosome-associated translation inhibitor RaiA [Hamadaea tsunoensis]